MREREARDATRDKVHHAAEAAVCYARYKVVLLQKERLRQPRTGEENGVRDLMIPLVFIAERPDDAEVTALRQFQESLVDGFD